MEKEAKQEGGAKEDLNQNNTQDESLNEEEPKRNYDRQHGRHNKQGGGYQKNRGHQKRNYDRGEGGNQEGGQNDFRRNDRGPRNFDRQKNNDHFDPKEVDPDSNYRRYYSNDPEFFVKVMGQENPPYIFKLHAFPNKKY